MAQGNTDQNLPDSPSLDTEEVTGGAVTNTFTGGVLSSELRGAIHSYAQQLTQREPTKTPEEVKNIIYSELSNPAGPFSGHITAGYAKVAKAFNADEDGFFGNSIKPLVADSNSMSEAAKQAVVLAGAGQGQTRGAQNNPRRGQSNESNESSRPAQQRQDEREDPSSNGDSSGQEGQEGQEVDENGGLVPASSLLESPIDAQQRQGQTVGQTVDSPDNNQTQGTSVDRDPNLREPAQGGNARGDENPENPENQKNSDDKAQEAAQIAGAANQTKDQGQGTAANENAQLPPNAEKSPSDATTTPSPAQLQQTSNPGIGGLNEASSGASGSKNNLPNPSNETASTQSTAVPAQQKTPNPTPTISTTPLPATSQGSQSGQSNSNAGTNTSANQAPNSSNDGASGGYRGTGVKKMPSLGALKSTISGGLVAGRNAMDAVDNLAQRGVGGVLQDAAKAKIKQLAKQAATKAAQASARAAAATAQSIASGISSAASAIGSALIANPFTGGIIVVFLTILFLGFLALGAPPGLATAIYCKPEAFPPGTRFAADRVVDPKIKALLEKSCGVANCGDGSSLASSLGMSLDNVPGLAAPTNCPEVNAFMRMITVTESGRGANPYVSGPQSVYYFRYGGIPFKPGGGHPRLGHLIDAGPNAGLTSDAAGRYQYISTTWDDVRQKVGLPDDFSPANQDKVTAAFMDQLGVRKQLCGTPGSDEVKARTAMRRLAGVWTSFEGGAEEQPGQTSKLIPTYLKLLEQERKLRSAMAPYENFADANGRVYVNLRTDFFGRLTVRSISKPQSEVTANAQNNLNTMQRSLATLKSTLQSVDTKSLSLLGPIDAEAAATRPTSYSSLTDGHKEFLKYIADAQGNVAYPDQGKVDPDAQKAANALIAFASKNGIPDLKIASGYRSNDAQVGTYFSKITKFYDEQKPIPGSVPQGIKDEYTNRTKLSAPPGYSEHSTGLAFDFAAPSTYPRSDELNAATYGGLGAWLAKNAPTFGFAISYGPGSTKGAGYEPWHYAYKGVDGSKDYPKPQKSLKDLEGKTTSESSSTGGGSCPGFDANGKIISTAKGQFIDPTAGKCVVTSEMGMRVNPKSGVYRLHAGIDLGCPTGTPIASSADGTVSSADGEDVGGYGNLITISHANGIETRYAHMSRIQVKVGQTVKQGEQIGLSGGGDGDPGRGTSTGPHLHFEIRPNKSAVNPRTYVSFK